MPEEDNDKQSGPRGRRRKRSRGKEAGGRAADSGAAPGGTVLLKGLASLDRLKSRVEGAVLEIERLRKENAALADRLQALEVQPSAHALSSFSSLDTDPEVLRRKITGFIEAIDRYLEKEAAPEDK